MNTYMNEYVNDHLIAMDNSIEEYAEIIKNLQTLLRSKNNEIEAFRSENRKLKQAINEVISKQA